MATRADDEVNVVEIQPLNSSCNVLRNSNTDCILCSLLLSVNVRDMVRGYADDVGMVINRIWTRPVPLNIYESLLCKTATLVQIRSTFVEIQPDEVDSLNPRRKK